VVEAAARRGLGVYGVGPYRMSSVGPGGLIFGYSTLSERTIAEGIGILAAVIEEVRSG
jgi:GntR family transcriptional regulator/MocR family aminotransferase